MKLSIGIFAAVSAVDPEFERPEACDEYDNTLRFDRLTKNYVNCWSPSGHFNGVHVNGTINYFEQVNSGGECGFQYIDTELSLVNKTCVFGRAQVDGSYEIGNGVFVPKGPGASPFEIVGLDITGDFNYVQKWDVTFNWEEEFNQQLDAYVDAVNEANKHNTTQPEPFTFDKTYACAAEIGNFLPPSVEGCRDSSPRGPYEQYAIMITNQQAGDKNNNYAIANYRGNTSDNVFTVQINKPCRNWGFTELDPNQATIEMIVQNENECTFVVTVGEHKATQLFYFQGSIDEGVIDFFNDITIA